MAGEPVARATIVLYDGAEKPIADEIEVEFDLTNNPYGIDRRESVKGPVFTIALQCFDGPRDNYRISVWVKGYRTVGAFIKADPKIHTVLRLMLIPVPTQLTFCPWADLVTSYPKIAEFLRLGLNDENAAQQRYLDLQKKPASLACFMNLVTAMSTIFIGSGKTPLDYLKTILWDDTFAQDRFFAYIDRSMIEAVQSSTEAKFKQEEDPGLLHKDATLSYKQIAYDYSNVQLTFHENDKTKVDGLECIKFEPDIDLDKNLLDHGVLEVLPNLLTHGLTNPIDVLSLRWLDTGDTQEQPFDPGYTLTKFQTPPR